jgi:hypothetical protein
MFAGANIHYESGDRVRGLDCGGIGAIHLLARRVGLIEAIDGALSLLKRHLPYHESDHVLNIAYNILAAGTCLQDLELRRNDEVYLDALGAERIPDPTTAGDFCRRFGESDVETLMDAMNRVRLDVWRPQPDSFFEEAFIDADGSLAETYGECKGGMGRSYNGTWGYHPLVISLANTGEPLYLVNRSGNRPSHEGAAHYLTAALLLCRAGGFRRITLRGDTDFSQTRELDGWNEEGARFIFGFDAAENLVEMAEGLGKPAWEALPHPSKHTVETEPRRRPERVKEQIVVEKGYLNIRTKSEEVSEFAYQPGNCKKVYRMVVVRKNLSVERGELALVDDVRYFFYITNDGKTPAAEIVFLARDRCDQENLIAQLKNGVHAMAMPVNDLVSNWAYMVMASLAWTLKAWFALSLPETGRWSEERRREKRSVLRMEFRTFVNAFMRLPCQLVRTGRRIIFRLLSWNPWMAVFVRAVEALRCPGLAGGARYPLRC